MFVQLTKLKKLGRMQNSGLPKMRCSSGTPFAPISKPSFVSLLFHAHHFLELPLSLPLPVTAILTQSRA
jgi:hypothetical protein